jgi:hypothetical protein
MRHLAILLWLMMAQTAVAQTVAVKSGDHPGFTRLVLELPQVANWQMGRTAEGYELQIKADNLRFDVSRVFDEIQRNRLAAIWTDPATGRLHLGIACACHALPFEFRPGIIVVDLRDGPPPKGSSFELALNGSGTADLTAKPRLRPKARPPSGAVAATETARATATYDWLAAQSAGDAATAVATVAPEFDFRDEPRDVGPLKNALLRQLSRGAAQGVVQMAQPSLSARLPSDPLPTGPRVAVHLGASPGFDVTTKRAPDNLLIKDGADCVADDRLTIADWGNDLAVSVQLADARAHLVGEFDKPNTDAVASAAKLLLHLGFGAEANQLLAQMPVDDPDVMLWHSMSKLVDGGSDPDGPFAGMSGCDTAAALWSVLAAPQIGPAGTPLTAAVLRHFSALPAHLRRSLGPDLAAKFLAFDDLPTAQAISNAVARGSVDPGPDLAVMDAAIQLHAGDPVAASAQLAPVLADAGPATADALIALVDTQVAAGEVVDTKTSVALGALVRENAGGPLDAALRRAQILALGSSGDFDQAFALLPDMPETEPELWQILAKAGSDTAVLTHAVLSQDESLPNIAQADRSQIAAHLLALGLPDAALRWIGGQSTGSPLPDRIVAAKAELAAGNPDQALQWLDGLDDATAWDVGATALWQQGKFSGAADAWAKAGNADAELRAQSWARDWNRLSNGDMSDWQAAAALVTKDPADAASDAPGPLALGTALIAESASARATLMALLDQIEGPNPAE